MEENSKTQNPRKDLFFVSLNGFLHSCELKSHESKDRVNYDLTVATVTVTDIASYANYHSTILHRRKFFCPRTKELRIIQCRNCFVQFLGKKCIAIFLAGYNQVPPGESGGPLDIRAGLVDLYLIVFDYREWYYTRIETDFSPECKTDSLLDLFSVTLSGSLTMLIHQRHSKQLFVLNLKDTMFTSLEESICGLTATDCETFKSRVMEYSISEVYMLHPSSSGSCAYISAYDKDRNTECKWIELLPLNSNIVSNTGDLLTVPCFYWPILTSARLLYLDKETLIFTTTHCQLMYSVDATFKLKCFDIPMSDCHSITHHEVGCGKRILLLESANGRKLAVFDVDKELIIGEWFSINSVHIDDFLGIGHNQMLIAFQELDDDGNYVTLLTDFSCCYHDSKEQRRIVEEEHSSEGYQNVKHNLAENNQKLLSDVGYLQALCQEKEALITETWNSLQNVVNSFQKKEVKSEFEEDLIRITGPADSDDKVGINLDLSGKDDIKGMIRCPVIWQRIVADQWVVGVEIENTGGKQIRCLSLFLVLNGSLVESELRFDTTTSAQSAIRQNVNQQATKKLKFELQDDQQPTFSPGMTTSLTTSTNIPDFSLKQNATANVMLSYFVDTVKEDPVEELQYLGQMTLRDEDMARGHYHVPSCMKDRSEMDWEAVEQGMCIRKVSLASKYAKSEDLHVVIKKVLSLKESHSSDDFAFFNNYHGLEVIITTTVNPICTMKVITRNKNLVTCALSSIRKSLPPDALIAHESDNSFNLDLEHRLMSSMESEISARLAVASISNLNQATDAKEVELTDEDLTDNRKFQQHCKRKRNEVYHNDKNQTDGLDTMRHYNEYLDAMVTTNTQFQSLLQKYVI